MNSDLICLVVSLQRATERRATISAALGGLDIPFTYIDAVDGRSIDLTRHAEVDAAGARLRMGRDLIPGEYGCALSHIATLRTFLASSAEYAMILEDDAIIDSDLGTYIRNGHYRSRPLVMLCHHRAEVSRFGGEKLFGSYRIHRATNSPYITAAFSLSRDSARRLLEASVPVRSTADWPMDITALNAEVTEPVLVAHPPMNHADFSMIGVRDYNIKKRNRRFRDYFTGKYWRHKWKKWTTRRIS